MAFRSKLIRQTGGEVETINTSAGDDIKDPGALAFFHTEAKFSRGDGQRVLWPRASSLYDACLRMHVIACKSNQHYHSVEDTSPNTAITFGFGNAVHYMIQNTPNFFGDRRVGLWKCSACQNVLYFGRPPKNKCNKCGAHPNAIMYHEFGFQPRNPLYCTGHTDMFLHVDAPKARPLEIKTIKDEAFDDLVAPLASHEFQIQTYFVLGEKDPFLMNHVDNQKGYILYVGKKIRKDSMPYKMFHITRTKSSSKSVTDRLDIFKKGYDQFPNNLPEPVNACSNSGFTSWKAKRCPCLGECKQYA